MHTTSLDLPLHGLMQVISIGTDIVLDGGRGHGSFDSDGQQLGIDFDGRLVQLLGFPAELRQGLVLCLDQSVDDLEVGYALFVFIVRPLFFKESTFLQLSAAQWGELPLAFAKGWEGFTSLYCRKMQ